MIIEHFMGKEICKNINEIPEILKKQTSKGVNEFWISINGDYPVLSVLTNQNYAYVHFFEEEGEPGLQIISDVDLGLDLDGESVFYTNTDTEEVNIENSCVVDIKRAIEIVHEFGVTHQLPKCIAWEEL